MSMEYKTVKNLLLDVQVLTANQAEEILDLWEENPRKYRDFLKNKEAALNLQGYVGVLPNGINHDFMVLETPVPSAAVAGKFFALCDTDITKRFIHIIENYSASRTGEICAWPYLKASLMNSFNEECLLEVVKTAFFVFDFSEDQQGRLFDSLFSRLSNSTSAELFAANSFNIVGWIQKMAKYSTRQFFKHFVMAEHFMNCGIGPEACLRKFYIRYRVETDELTEQMANMASLSGSAKINNFAN